MGEEPQGMWGNRVDKSDPQLRVDLGVHPSLDRVLNPADRLHEAIRREISMGVLDLMGTLGIPGGPAVEISPVAAESSGTERFFRLIVNDRICHYPDELLQRVRSYVAGAQHASEVRPDRILAWLREVSRQGDAKADCQVAEFLSKACVEIIKGTSGVLLGFDQVSAYRAQLIKLIDARPSPPGYVLPEAP